MAFDKAGCLQCLCGLQTTLELIAKLDRDAWDSEQHRWCGPSNDGDGVIVTYDISGTLLGYCEESGMRSVGEWIEFNTDSGPARRKNLANGVGSLHKEIKAVEKPQTRDAIRWMTESRDAAAEKVSRQESDAARYVSGLIELVERTQDEYVGPLSPTAWAKRFEVSTTTFSRMKKQMRVDEITSKRIRIHRDDVARHENK